MSAAGSNMIPKQEQERNYPVNFSSFAPFSYTTQQSYLQRQQAQPSVPPGQQYQPNRIKMSQVNNPNRDNLMTSQSPDYSSTYDDDVEI